MSIKPTIVSADWLDAIRAVVFKGLGQSQPLKPQRWDMLDVLPHAMDHVLLLNSEELNQLFIDALATMRPWQRAVALAHVLSLAIAPEDLARSDKPDAS